MESILLALAFFGLTVLFTSIFNSKITSTFNLKNRGVNLEQDYTLFNKDKKNEANKLYSSAIEKDKELVDKALSLIEINFSNPYFNCEKIASTLNISQRSIQRKFKNLGKESPSRLIKSKRLEYATIQLNSGKQIKNIVFESGFSSQSYFCKCFKEKYGCTPSEHLIKIQNNNN